MKLLSPGKNNASLRYSEAIPTSGENDTCLFDILTKMFTLSEDEQIRAGIYIGAKGRDLIERSSLIIPSFHDDQEKPKRID